MRLLLIVPLPRCALVLSNLFAGGFVGVLQVYAFLLLAALFGVDLPPAGYLLILPALIIAGFMLGALGLLISSLVQQLENFATVMNFVIFPVFFLSSALYPLWRMRERSEFLYYVCAVNPFTYAVELIRFSAYSAFSSMSLLVVVVTGILFFGFSVIAYTPARAGRRGRGPSQT